MAILPGVPIAQGTGNGDKTLKDDFWPDVSIAIFRDKYRVIDSVTNGECETALIKSLLFVTRALTSLKDDAINEGIAKFADIPSLRFFGTTLHLSQFEIAVFSYAKASILEKYRDIDTTRLAGSDKAKEVEPSISELKADCTSAIRELLGKPSTFVALI